MRVKLTAKHPRPATADRAPVRSGSASARKPTRPAGAKAAPSGGVPRAPATGGAKRAAGGAAATAPRPSTKRGTAFARRDAGPARSGGTPRAAAEGAKRPYAERSTRSEAPTGDVRRNPGARDRTERPAGASGERERSERSARSGGEREYAKRPAGTRTDKPREGGPRGDRTPFERPTRSDGERRRAPSERAGAPRRDASERTRTGYGEGRPAGKARDASERSFGSPARGDRKIGSPIKRSDVDRGERASGTPVKRFADDRAERRSGGERGDRPRRADPGAAPHARRYGDRPTRDDKPARRPPAGAPVRAAAIPHQHAEAHADETGMMRLSKRMSELGLCSRREADEWIEKGWVLVDGVRIDTLGTKVRAEQRIEIVANARAEQAKQVTILLHKPVGYVSGQAEDGYQPAVTLITPANHWDNDRSDTRFSPVQLRALAPAGRLDIDSTGLLVLTQDGRVAKQLIGEHSDIDKEYLVRVTYGEHTTGIDQHFPVEDLAKLRHGLSLDDVPLKPAQVSWQNGEQLRFVLREGKKRQIRRMCELVGLEVVGLKRVRMGRVTLGALPQGQWRYLLPDETF
jgi:23S rRNA pseudouridine2604 synthase